MQAADDRSPMNRHNNFDVLRLVAATSVIFSHAFLLSQGSEDNEPLKWLTGQTILGLVGVFVFFVISGFLVTQSYETTGSPARFAAKRALRIYPGYVVCIMLCTFALGPLVGTLPLSAYLASGGTWDFLLSNLVMNVEHNSLPGVTFTDFGFGRVVDGPLWSLPSEMVMYAMVLVLGSLRALRLGVLVPLLALGLARLVFDGPGRQFFADGAWLVRFAWDTAWLLAFFVAGMLLYKLRHTRIFNGPIALVALMGLIASVPLNQFIVLFPLFGAYLILYLALNPRVPVLRAARFGDLSYGLYIYGWPVEQTLLYASGGKLAWWQLFPLALAITGVIALASWHLVEKPALRRKPTATIPAPAPTPA
jgi:peptidoglycan/LPS O-acetylase OafA/YrhL